MIKKYALVFITLLCSFFYGFGQTYNQITNIGDLTNGNYLIVGDGNTNDGLMINSTSGSVYIDYTNITNPGATITTGFTNNNVFEITVSGGIITINNSSVGYVSWGRSGVTGNDADFYNGTLANTERWTPSVNSGLWSFANVDDSSRVLQWNNSSPRFVAYTSNQVKLKLYKEDVASSDLSISGTPTNHGSSCLNTAATTVQYTITNNGVVPALNIAVASDDPQFAVSNLSSTTIAASGTATYDVTFTPTATGVQSAIITVSSTTTSDVTSNLTGTGIIVPSITLQPTNQSAVIPNTANFNVVATGATSYQWEINTGSGWNNVSTGTGGTTNSYTTPATTEAMNGYQYRCVVTNTCGSVTSNAATLTLSNSSPNNAQNLSGCFDDTSVILTWNNPATPPTGGYVIFAIAGTTDPTAPPNDAGTYTANSDFSAAPFETPASLGKVVYKGNGTTTTVTGLTEGATYSFRIFAYNGETLTGWSNGTSGGSNLENIAQGDVSNLTAIPLTNQVTLNWNNPTPTSCFDELIIVANQGTVTFNPTGTYAPIDVNYSTPNTVVYATTGTVSSKAINGLTNGLNYCFKVYIRRGSIWSEGVEVCTTPNLTYCTSDGGTNSSGILNVKLNTIDNTTISTNSYTDYTAISTDLTLGESYNLSINVNTGGNYTSNVKVWIDWNQDGTFNNSGNEAFELGTTTNSTDAQPSLSPLSITVPSNASIGSLRMRVSSKSDNGEPYATPCEDFSFGEVEDYTINVVQPTTAEINIKGNNISIPNGFNAPYGLNNTLFGATDLTGPYTEKSYFISNLGLTTLNLTNNPIVEIIGTHPGDFIVTQQPSANSIASGSGDLEFRVEFRPTSSGLREAQVRIYNNDSTGGENPYVFDIEGTGTCSTTITSNIWPIEGPEDTEVTITSATDLTGAYAELNGVTMPIISTTASELIVSVPPNATDGNLVVTFSTGCSSTNSFDVLDTAVGGCDNSSSNTLSDLFISEVTDATSGSSTYVEIYNGTPNTVNLSDYSVNVYNNGSASPSSANTLTGTLASGGIYVVSLGTTSCALNNLSISANQSFGSSSGINYGNNSADMIGLYKISTSSIIDAYGVFGSNSWSNSLGVGVDGVNFRRKNTATPLPSSAFNLADWDIIDWTSCNDSDYINIGQFDFSLGVPPTITLNPVANNTNCDNSIDLIVSGTEGVANGQTLAYRWYYLAPNSSTWTEITSDGGPYTGFDQATLTVSFSDTIDVNGYQYYCQVRESSATCYSASNAVKINHERAFWDSNNWSSIPDNSKLTIINDDYITSGGGTEISFEACNLIINAGHTLTISNSTYVNVVNNVTNYGTINIQTRGSFVQQGDGVAAGTFTNSGAGIANVAKTTAQFDSSVSQINYTYWSSPVNDPNNPGFAQDITTVFPSPVGNRRYYFMAQNYIDSFIETANDNDNTTNPGQDDIDDDANDWTYASGNMEVGRGYAVTTSGIPPPIPSPLYTDNSTVFSGALNTGDITVTIYKNNNEINDNNWNFIGNPYPSAIDVDLFFNANIDDVPLNPTVNGLTEGAIFLWSQSVAPDAGNNGNNQINFAQSDYAIINRVTATAGTSGITPNRYIPSGQGFFVALTENLNASENTVTTGNVVFTNSMRRTGDNTQFFEANDGSEDIRTTDSNNVYEKNILWLNMSSDNGVFSQIAVAYANGATDGDDGWSYDTPRNLSTGTFASFYSIIPDSNRQFAIQGKSPESLNLDEIIPLGFNTSIDEATLYTISIAQLEGNFMSQNDIYIKDKLLNITHNLKESDYSFTSEVGDFTDRFDLAFTRETLSINDVKPDNNSLQIIELQNGNVQFKVSSAFEMKSIEIIDLLGRTHYKLDAQGNSQIFSLSNLSQAPYLAKVKLTNGYTITKKALKRN